MSLNRRAISPFREETKVISKNKNPVDSGHKLSHTSPESQRESELSEELRAFMADEACSVSPNLIPRRGFLKRIVQVSLPAGIALGTAGVASACWLCDEGWWNICLTDFCLTDFCSPCDTQAVLCPNNRVCPNGDLPIGCTGLNMIGEYYNSPNPPSPDLEEIQSNGVNKQLEF